MTIDELAAEAGIIQSDAYIRAARSRIAGNSQQEQDADDAYYFACKVLTDAAYTAAQARREANDISREVAAEAERQAEVNGMARCRDGIDGLNRA
jgi:hypothetical protein